MQPTIRVSAVVMRDENGRVLNVRKRGTHALMLPGGKNEPGEDPRDTAIREFAEELGVQLDGLKLRSLGEYTTAAANEPGHTLVAAVFEHPFVPAAEPQAEIEHLEWVDPAVSRTDMAPLNTEHVFPALRAPGRKPARLTVFTGSATGASPAYAEAAVELAAECARAGIGIVYGGGNVGLMGIAANAAQGAGGEVIGVIPQGLVDSEIAHPHLTRLEVVGDMHARKHRMASLSDASVALPGGLGTLEELFEAWTWVTLGFQTKPVALYDVDGYWQPLLDMLDRMVERRFLAEEYRSSLIVADNPAELLAQLSAWQPPSKKWAREK